MKTKVMKDRQAIKAKRQKRDELESGEQSLEEPFDGVRESKYEMDDMKSIFNKCLEIPYMFEGLMVVFVLVFFYLINTMPDKKEKK